MRRKQIIPNTLAALLGSAAFIAGGLAGCAGGIGVPADGDGAGINAQGEGLVTGTTALALMSDILGDTDVAQMQFTITRVPCAGEVADPAWAPVTVVKPLEDMMIPSHMPALEDRPFDAGSGHLFADHFQTCEAGCYDVAVQPLDGGGGVSADCAPAGRNGVLVEDGVTHELLLIHQCDGPQAGAKDVLAALNHSPEILEVTYDPTKFLYECEFLRLCATVRDPDGDPLEFVWEQSGGPPMFLAPVVVDDHQDGDLRTQCVQLVPAQAASYEVRVTVYDLAHDGGQLTRIENILAQYGGGGTSHDAMAVPVHVNWDVELLCFDAGGALVRRPNTRIPQRHAQCDWVTPEEFYCNPDWAPVAQTCPGGVYNPRAVYPRCDGTPPEPPDPPDPPCGDCVGKVTKLTMQWNGDARARITVWQGDRTPVFDQDVDAGGRFTFEGTMPDGSLGDVMWLKVNGHNRHDIRTNCRRDLTPGTQFGDFEIISGESSEGGRFCIDEPPGCDDCRGTVDDLTLRWLGNQPVTITIKQHDRRVVFEEVVQPGQPFTAAGQMADGTFGAVIWIQVNHHNRHDIRTDCTWDLSPGVVFGEFQVIGGSSSQGGQFCGDDPPPPPPPPPGCRDCQGQVNSLLLRWDGNRAAEIEVIQQDGREVFDDDNVQPGEVIEVRGQMANGSLGNIIWIQIDDQLMADVWTDCRVDLSPGTRIGDLTVVGGSSTQGGAFCGDAPPPPPMCQPCRANLTRMTLRWTGSRAAQIRIVQWDRRDIFNERVPVNGEFTFVGTVGNNGDQGLGPVIWVKVDGVNRHDPRTDCSWDLGPGAMFGEFVVVESHSAAGPVCMAGGGD